MRSGKSSGKGRSTITNGKRLIPRTKGADIVDGRSAYMRRFKDLMRMHHADLGGIDNLSEAEQAIIRRAVTLIIILERLEFDFAASDELKTPSAASITQYSQVANTVKRLLESLGLKRRSKDITPDLASYLKSRQPRLIDHDDDEPEQLRINGNGSTHRVRS
jgi:hypothetical protein